VSGMLKNHLEIHRALILGPAVMADIKTTCHEVTYQVKCFKSLNFEVNHFL
jgi:hypothetical protein